MDNRLILIKDFIDSYDDLKAYSLTCEFDDVVNEVDSVTYPLICKDIPDHVRSEVLAGIEQIIGSAPDSPVMFMRLSPKGVDVPHIFHNDESMGKYSLMLYLNDGQFGTALAEHKATGCRSTPCDIEQIIPDQNKPDRWSIYYAAPMKQNLAAIFNASYFHCALPIGGFGMTRDTARCVLTCFFS